MTQTLFQQLPQQDNLCPQAQLALDYWQGYGALSREESWRWTPLKSLRSRNWSFDSADYQFSLPEEVEEGFATDAEFDARLLALKDAPFAALNVALLDDVLILRVPKDTQAKELIALNIDQMQQSLQFSRVNLIVESGASAVFWFDYRCRDNGGQIPVIHMEVEQGANVDGAIWLTGGEKSPQLAYMTCEQHENSEVKLTAVEQKGALSRMDVNVQLLGEQAAFSFGGIQSLEGNQIGDYHVTVNHLVPECNSKQIVRGALNDDSFGIFDGLIFVAQDAQKTDAKQDSRYVLLSQQAKSHGVPRLEIYADDVRCTHGSTVGFVDPEALFYLQSRGISQEEARRILVLSFLHEAVVSTHPLLTTQLHDAVTETWLNEGD